MLVTVILIREALERDCPAAHHGPRGFAELGHLPNDRSRRRADFDTLSCAAMLVSSSEYIFSLIHLRRTNAVVTFPTYSADFFWVEKLKV